MGKNAHRTKSFDSFHILFPSSLLSSLLFLPSPFLPFFPPAFSDFSFSPPSPLSSLSFFFSAFPYPFSPLLLSSSFSCMTPQKFLCDTQWVELERARLVIKRPPRMERSLLKSKWKWNHNTWKTPSDEKSGFLEQKFGKISWISKLCRLLIVYMITTLYSLKWTLWSKKDAV